MIWRVRGRRVFQSLSRSGQRARTKSLWCTYLNDPATVPLRVAFSVGRSLGPATTRNRLRRRMRVIVADVAPGTGITHGVLLIGAKPAATKHTFDELRALVAELLVLLTNHTPT